MKNLLNKLDNPQFENKTIHIVGTNGKGSTLTFLKNILIGHGYQIGTFISPFIVKFNERISFNNKSISDDDLEDIVNFIFPIVKDIDNSNPDLSPSEFEIITAIMFIYFKKNPVDYLLIEAGIGGRDDSTNVVDSILTIITNVGLDHTKLLGNTVEKIAENKADVITKNTNVVVGKVNDSIFEKINQVAISRNAKIARFNQDYGFKKIDQALYKIIDQNFILDSNKMLMNNQVEILNATVAIEALKFILDEKLIDENIVLESIYKTTWPGRYEKINSNPDIYIDGAHNLPAIKELNNMIIQGQFGNKLVVILAIFEDKDYLDMIYELLYNKNIELVLTNFNVNENRPTAKLNNYAKKFEIDFYENWIDAYESKKNKNNILFTGSLLFISEVRKKLGLFKN
ncbi:bifunctional folylpolyglutamate synthase/dihydrofolate synthase [Lactobacillus sp. S2-2]|uniref:bifunctional folylpolyglutamate synthase/dihydrofolate synthase n=1 Tax=Lactobacillus sp. S2-2 TaxID=2692917 RepID=UPI001F17CC32|nr:bifunctional folylpolyglutamate synthase/dihydrofolate synthase [Lactobacillus sp. S2-2]MCF6515789.1 bifunctional folylpolyglutamate synthase/dihydrofolate synthase [Lactobacillus sp. S2-2]